MEPTQKPKRKPRKKKVRTEEDLEIGQDADASSGIDDGEEIEEGSDKVYFEDEPTPENPILTSRQELFCKLFAQDRECFGVGVRAYKVAYPDCSYDSARSCAYRLLTNAHILSRIDELMDVFINDQIVDKELSRVILQSGNYNAKVRAVNEYNKLKGRIIDRKDITSGGKALSTADPETVAKIDNLIDTILNGKPNTPATNQGDTGEQRPQKA